MIPFLAAAQLKARWRWVLVVGLFVAVWCLTTTAALAGARRTASAPDRFRVATAASDASFGFSERAAEPVALLDAVRRLPEVLDADLAWFATTGLGGDAGFVNLVVGTGGRWGVDLDRALVLEGRAADPASHDEVVVTQAVADLLDVGPGDRLDVTTWAKATWEAWQVDRGRYPPFDGPRMPVTVVGVVRLALDLQASSESDRMVLATPAFYERHGAGIGENGHVVYARLRDPAGDVQALASRLSDELGTTVTATTAAEAWETQLRDAARVARMALVVLATVVGLAGAVTVLAVVDRDLRLAVGRTAVLPALGARRTAWVTGLGVPDLVGAAVGAVGGAAGAVLVSGWFPLPPARLAEPRPGRWADTPVLAAVALLAVGWVAAAGLVAGHRAAAHQARGVSRPADRGAGATSRWHWPTVLAGWLGPAAAVGHRRALRGRDRRWAWGGLVAVTAALVATCWFAASLARLGAQPSRWGYVWSSSPELGFEPSRLEAATEETIGHPGVASMATLASGTVRLGDTATTVSTFFVQGGSPVEPPVLDGRLPSTIGEIALGPRTARRLDARLGDLVSLERGGRSEAFTIVGTIVVPPQLLTTNLGEGVLVTPAAFERRVRVPLDEASLLLVLTYRDGTEAAGVERDLAASPGWVFGSRSHAAQPSALANVVRVGPLLWWIAALLGALGLSAVGVIATRRGTARSGEAAVLLALGFTRHDRRVAAAADAATVGGAALLVGIPLGLAGGAAAWRRAVEFLFVVDEPSSPAGLVALAVAALAVAVAVAYVVGGRRPVASPAHDS